ncbi:hypothetical protein MFLO_15755 [Listeria floridensis FSL S10-1187]|uniref:Uncharacterized protein n=1 Tax=Listeria floridensis FSL S10-1187 TaxID=1265817 RepID=A0ABP3AVZ4_9LIST|nr:hypothetical protein [Listeria floridensis]EUJ23998.1 hypothetical protein MFLO_15755 [Listeria floridensis FSL S10-1187]
MAKLNVTADDIQFFKETGALAVGTDDGYVLVEELKAVSKINRKSEIYLVRRVPQNTLHKLIINTKYANKHDFEGRLHSVFMTTVEEAQAKKVARNLQKKPAITPVTAEWCDKLKVLKEEF